MIKAANLPLRRGINQSERESLQPEPRKADSPATPHKSLPGTYGKQSHAISHSVPGWQQCLVDETGSGKPGSSGSHAPGLGSVQPDLVVGDVLDERPNYVVSDLFVWREGV